jgi:hypothetical protein
MKAKIHYRNDLFIATGAIKKKFSKEEKLCVLPSRAQIAEN